MTYRRRIWSRVWHFREDCSHWPARLFKERQTKPTTGTQCDQCQSLARRQRRINKENAQ